MPTVAGRTSDATRLTSVPNGSVTATDATVVGLDDDFATHVYVVRYHYDLDGRRDTLFIPATVGSNYFQRYSYNAVTGDLDASVDAVGYMHRVTRDLRGRVVAQDSPGWHVDRTFDDDDNIVAYNGMVRCSLRNHSCLIYSTEGREIAKEGGLALGQIIAAYAAVAIVSGVILALLSRAVVAPRVISGAPGMSPWGTAALSRRGRDHV